MMAAWSDMVNKMDVAGRLAGFAKLQQRAYDQVYVFKMGDISRFTATQASVRNFIPYRITRYYNVWLDK